MHVMHPTCPLHPRCCVGYLASDPLMILSFLQEQMNILRERKKKSTESAWKQFVMSVSLFLFYVGHDVGRYIYLLPGHVAGEHEVAVLVLIGDGELAAAVGRGGGGGGGGEAAEERVQRVPQFPVAAVGPQVDLAEVGRPVHAHLHVQAAASSLLLLALIIGPPRRLRRRVERVLPVRSHRRPPHRPHPATFVHEHQLDHQQLAPDANNEKGHAYACAGARLGIASRHLLGGRCGVVVMVARPGRVALHHRRGRPFRRRSRRRRRRRRLPRRCRRHDGDDDVAVVAPGRAKTQLRVDHLHAGRAPTLITDER
jgi:hypothetical protein